MLAPIGARHAELCNTHPAVSTYPLPRSSLVALVARAEDGTVKVAEVRESVSGDELDVDAAIDALAQARQQAQRAADLASSNLAAYLSRHRGAVNFAELERRTGIGRSTLYYLANETAAAA